MAGTLYISTVGLNPNEQNMLDKALCVFDKGTLKVCGEPEKADVLFIDKDCTGTSENNLAKYIIAVGEKPKFQVFRGRLVNDHLPRPLRYNHILSCLEKYLKSTKKYMH